jgi:hypothetical protein
MTECREATEAHGHDHDHEGPSNELAITAETANEEADQREKRGEDPHHPGSPIGHQLHGLTRSHHHAAALRRVLPRGRHALVWGARRSLVAPSPVIKPIGVSANARFGTRQRRGSMGGSVGFPVGSLIGETATAPCRTQRLQAQRQLRRHEQPLVASRSSQVPTMTGRSSASCRCLKTLPTRSITRTSLSLTGKP